MEPPQAPPPQTSSPQEHAAWVREAAAQLGLHLRPSHLPGVVENYRRLAQQGNLIMTFALDDRDEPAAVYRP